MKKAIGIGIATAVLHCAAFSADAPANTQKLTDPVNPARCKTGNKAYVYWAAKDQVFRFKYDPKKPLYPFAEKETTGIALEAKLEVPAAPNPSEPEGCYGNPLRAMQVPYMDAFDAQLFQQLAGRKLEFGVRKRGFYALPTNYYKFNLEESLFLKSKNCWQRLSGIQECSLANTTEKEPAEYLIAHPLKIGKDFLPKHPQVSDVYVTVQLTYRPLAPNGKKWLTADSRILLFGNVSLESSFDLFANEIDLLILYYSGLIRYVLDAHVPDYRWTTTNSQ